jgi:hypothetical protein
LSQFALYRDPVLLEPVKHRHLKMAKLTDRGMAAAMQASFLAVAEFASAAREFVIVFMRDTIDGKLQAEPIMLLGVAPGENLYVDGTRWDAHYVPAFIRRYPFWLTTVQGVEAPVVMIDQAWSGFSETEGDPLYEDDGKPAPRLAEAIEFREGRQLALDGLLTVDDAKLQALPDAQVLEMHRNGMLGLVHAHLLSLANMQALVERKGKRLQQGRQPAPQA